MYTKFDFPIHFVDDYMEKSKGLNLTAKDGWGSDAPAYLNAFYQEYHLDLKAPTFKNVGYWFRPRVIFELTLIKNAIRETENKNIRNFFFVAISEIIRLVSNRRNGEFKMFRMTPGKGCKVQSRYKARVY